MKILLLVLIFLNYRICAEEVKAVEHVVAYDVILIGEYRKVGSGGGYLIFDILKGSVDKNLFGFTKRTPDLGGRGDGSRVLFLYKRDRGFKFEKHIINKMDLVSLGIEGVGDECSIEEIRKALLND